MRGWTTGSRTFTSAVADTTPCRSPNKAPTSQPLGVDRGEDRVVDEREHLTGHQVQQIPERLGARSIAGERGAEQERQVDAGQPELVGRPQGRGQHQRADEAPGEGSPEAHRSLASAIETAALMRARWTSPCGMLPNSSLV